MLGRRSIAAVSLLLTLSVFLPAARSAEPDAKGIDPKVAEVMRRLDDFAPILRSFSVNIEFNFRTTVGEPEQRMTLNHIVSAQKPDKLRIENALEKSKSLFLVNGKLLTLYIPTLKSYQEREALPHLEQLLVTAGPGANFLSGLFAMPPSSYYVKEGMKCEYLGEGQVAGKNCDHLKFTEAHPDKNMSFNWEAWFQQGDQPLPLKLVPDMSTAGLATEFLYKEWCINPGFAEDVFTFKPPDGVKRSDNLFNAVLEGAEPGETTALLGKPAPDFVLPLIGGGELDLKRHVGKQVIILDFFATWCGVCRASMPTVDQLMQQYKGREVVLYAVDGDAQEDAATIHAFLNELKISPTVALDSDSRVSDAYGVSGLPTMVIVGKDGTVQAVHLGVPHDVGKYVQQLQHELDELLAGKKLTQ